MKLKKSVERDNMRKYYQAALAVIAVVSLVSLLVYRHEYNRLRYVLEVFNYFGKPGLKSADTNCTNFASTFTAFNARFDEPMPSWQRLEDDLYVYSAYRLDNRNIKAVALGTANSVASVQCLVFFENESKPILGNFKFLPIVSEVASRRKDNTKYAGYHFICTYVNTNGVKIPTGVTFLTKSNKFLNYAPVLPIKSQPESLSHKRIGVCVTQSLTKPTQATDIINFVNFHSLIGMNNFIVYDSGIPNEINIRLKEISNDPTLFWKFTYTVIPWNFPFMDIDQNVIREIMEIDCLYRTYNSVAYAIALSWNEYVVLKYHHTAIDLMADFERYSIGKLGRLTTRLTASRYALNTTTFCTQQADNKQYADSNIMVLKKTMKVDGNVVKDHYPIYMYDPFAYVNSVISQNSHTHTKETGIDLVAVNHYKYCDNYKDGQGVEDTAILRFAQDLQNSPILTKYYNNVPDIDIK